MFGLSRHCKDLTALPHVAEAVETNKAPRQSTLYLAKEMGVVRAGKEMASPKVAEIPVSFSLPGPCARMPAFVQFVTLVDP